MLFLHNPIFYSGTKELFFFELLSFGAAVWSMPLCSRVLCGFFSINYLRKTIGIQEYFAGPREASRPRASTTPVPLVVQAGDSAHGGPGPDPCRQTCSGPGTTYLLQAGRTSRHLRRRHFFFFLDT